MTGKNWIKLLAVYSLLRKILLANFAQKGVIFKAQQSELVIKYTTFPSLISVAADAIGLLCATTNYNEPIR
jgi:hypothetical protein